MRFVRDVVAILRDPLTLGLSALVLAACGLYWATGLAAQTAEDRCRDKIDAVLLVEMARSLQRLESVWRYDAVGDEWGATDVVTATDEESDAYERAIVRRENAVVICK